MSVELIDDGRIAGEKAYNADVDTSAAIKPIKIEKKSIYLNWVIQNFAISAATSSASNAFPGWNMVDSGAASLIMQLLSPMAEIVPGENATLHIWWMTAATTGNVRWVIDIKPVITGFTTLTSAITRSVITPAGSASTFIDSKVLLPAAVFSNNQLIGLQIARDPTNSLDTIGADAIIRAVYLEINGRC